MYRPSLCYFIVLAVPDRTTTVTNCCSSLSIITNDLCAMLCDSRCALYAFNFLVVTKVFTSFESFICVNLFQDDFVCQR